jgi:tRNA(Ile2) C34 agmatinyltransferase TiaS
MYYKEEWINGKLFWKATPNGEWVEFTKQQYIERCLKLETELKNLRVGAVMPSVCPSCNGKLEKTPYNYVRCEDCEKTYRQTEA